jgi:basic membrane lipoprotein Med (substrate-binding protein (PBP1-ABC) superfamily)
MSKLKLRLVLAAALTLACGGGESAPPPPAFRVALLTPGSIADGGWNAGAYEGLQRIARELGAEVSHVETRTPAEFEEGFRDYAARAYDLVFGHGFEYQEAAARVAAEYSDTIFVTTSGSTVRPNVAPMVFELEQATYLCGVIAARMTKTRSVGLVGGVDLPSIRSTFMALGGGVADTRPTVRVREVFIGNFDDTAAAREAALALFEEGADFLMHQANDAGRGVFQAAQEWVAQGHVAYVFGTNRDQNAMAPDVVLASAVLDLPGAFLEVARRVKEGRFNAEPMRLGMAQGIVSLVVNPALRERIPPEVLDEVARIEAEIRSGQRTVPRGDF